MSVISGHASGSGCKDKIYNQLNCTQFIEASFLSRNYDILHISVDKSNKNGFLHRQVALFTTKVIKVVKITSRVRTSQKANILHFE